MRRHAPRLLASAVFAGVVAAVLIAGMPGVQAGYPPGAYYSADTDKVFWFLQASDLHVGTGDSSDTNNLRWLVTTGRTTVNPSFIVVTGDLTDSTNANWLGIPNGPYQAEWDAYKSIVDNTPGLTALNYYDLPGNHDAYNDRYFAYYLANSVQGRATGKTQHSWTRTHTLGKYHFLGVNTADNTGDGFSIFWPYGDYAGLDATELSYIRQELAAHADARLTFVFGHHPLAATGSSTDTYVYYGQEQFVGDLDYYRGSSYGYGHTHADSDTHFTAAMVNGGIRYPNVDALGKDSPFTYRLFAVDCDGVSSVVQPVGTWPLVMVTAPVSKFVGSTANPYLYTVPNAATNTIRALAFDVVPVTVWFRIDGSATWLAMTQVPGNTALWSGAWDASGLLPGEHTIEVRAIGSSTRYHAIKVDVTGAPPPNQPPVANADTYSTAANTTLTVPAPSGVLSNDTDPENQDLTVASHTNPSHGTLTLNAVDGSFTYVPAGDYSGADTFKYAAEDSEGAISTEATVSLTITAPPPPVTDTVTITAATWSSKTKKLSVTAKSSVQPNATLTLYINGSTTAAGTMVWSAKKASYSLSISVPTKPASVTVKSSKGGSATTNVS